MVYAPGLEPLFESGTSLVEVLELEPQTLWYLDQATENPFQYRHDSLEYLRSLPQAKIIHGVGFPVGGTRLPDPLHIPPFVQAINALDAVWASEHLAFNQASDKDGLYTTGFFLPPLQTIAGLIAAIDSIRFVSSQLPVPFAIETGVNYLRPIPGEIPDGSFISSITRSANCGIVLDLHNIWANELNGRQEADEFIDQLPLDRVWELHLAGGFNYQGYWLDAHSGAIPEPVLKIARKIIPRLPNLGAIIFELMPAYLTFFGIENIKKQLNALHELWTWRKESNSFNSDQLQPTTVEESFPLSNLNLTPTQWEDALSARIIKNRIDANLSQFYVNDDPAIPILQQLIKKFRASAIAINLRLTIRYLLLNLGDSDLQRVISDYVLKIKPQLFSSNEALEFSNYLLDIDLKIIGLHDLMKYELAAMKALATNKTVIILLLIEPYGLIEAISKGKLPEKLEYGNYEVEVTP